MIENDHKSDPEAAWDFVRVCRYEPSRTRLLDPHGCDTCDCRDENLLHDERGEPFHADDPPAR